MKYANKNNSTDKINTKIIALKEKIKNYDNFKDDKKKEIDDELLRLYKNNSYAAIESIKENLLPATDNLIDLLNKKANFDDIKELKEKQDIIWKNKTELINKNHELLTNIRNKLIKENAYLKNQYSSLNNKIDKDNKDFEETLDDKSKTLKKLIAENYSEEDQQKINDLFSRQILSQPA